MTGHDCPKNKAVIISGKIVEGCDLDFSTLTRPNELAAQNRRNHQRREYARDITQPFEKSYPKAVGIDKAREAGWDDESLRKYA